MSKEMNFSRRDLCGREQLRRRGLLHHSRFADLGKAESGERGAEPDEKSAIRLGIASYTFRNFNREQMIGF